MSAAFVVSAKCSACDFEVACDESPVLAFAFVGAAMDRHSKEGHRL